MFMSLLYYHTAWAGYIENMVAMSIRESSRPLIDLTRNNDESGPSGAMKEEPADPRGKYDTVHNDENKFYQYYDHSSRCRRR
jgi:hypothetical protein